MFSRYLKKELRIVRPEAALLFGLVKGYQTQIDAILGTPGHTVLAHHPSRSPLWWSRTPAGQEDRKRIIRQLQRLLNLVEEDRP